MIRAIILSILFLIGNEFLLAQVSYRFKSKEINLKIDSTLYFIQSDNRILTDLTNAELNKKLKSKEIDRYDKISDNRFLISSRKSDMDIKGYFSNVYHNEQKSKIIILPRIVVMLKKDESIENILKSYIEELSIEAGEKQKWVLKCHLNKSEDVLKITNEIYKRKDVEWCEPELFSELHFYNPLYPQQYYLRNTGQNGGTSGVDINVEPAWKITNGRNDITVAVIDQGVEEHEDLTGRVIDGYTIGNTTGLGRPQNENTLSEKGHGQACAGIIAASNNTIGIRGIASNVQILPVNIAPYSAYLDYWGNVIEFGSNIEIARAINWAWKRADILSCSWGGGNPSSDITLAIDSARTYGRNGKGTVVVFASGNNWGHPNITDVSFPASVNGVITVGAVNNKGIIWGYSQRGASMDLVAPSGNVNLNGDVRTTDRMGNLGYNNGNYMNNFGGTSAACPQVTGIAALMLSVRPDLTEAQVRTTLQNTARDLGTSGFDNTYGYGLVNAYAAVNAVVPIISGPPTICDQATYTINNLPPGAAVQWSCGPYLAVSSGGNDSSCTVTVSGNGFSWIKAIINGVQEVEKSDIQVGCPSPTYIETKVGPNNTLYPYIPYLCDAEAHWTGLYKWNILEYDWQSNGWDILPHPMEPFPGWDPMSIVRFSPVSPSNPTYVRIRARNSCGWGEWSDIRSVNVSYNKPTSFSLSPNPAITSITIQLEELNEVAANIQTFSGQKANKTTSSGISEIQLWSTTSLLRTHKTDQTTYQISVSDLPKGIYIVRVIKDGKTYTQKLIKN